jgi:methyl-accepting chemotaxis protein
MKNLKIRAKLLITFMIVIFLFLITVIGAISGLQQNEERYSEFYHVGYRITNKIMSMRRGLQVIGKNLGYITIEHNSAEAEEYLADIQEEIALLNENATWLAENLEGNREQLLTFGDEAERALAVKNQVLEMAAVDVAKAQEMLLNEYQPLVEEAVKTLEQISNAAEADAENDYQNTVKLQSSLIVLQLSMAGVAFLCTILLCIYLTNSITKPAKELEVAAKKIVQGDFNIAVTYESRDELGSLAKTFKNMTVMLDGVISDASRLLKEMADGNFNVHTQKEEYYLGNFRGLLMSIRKLNRDLSSTLSQINHSADMVASGSGQVSNGAQALAQGATQQAASVQELAATITNISHQVKNTADNALEARDQSNTAGGKVEECNGQMQDMMTAMEEITRTSNEIGKIIKTIEDIAFQTNILALNAAVEASRAGVAGKGFAVVADEVRSLAGKSSEASKNTAELIESSIKAVARGTRIADSTAQSLLQVVDQVRTVSAKVDMIADAAEEQSGAIEQVTLGVDQISSVVQTNSATSEQSAAASQELSDQAEKLKGLVAKFILRAENVGTAGSAGQVSAGYINLD